MTTAFLLALSQCVKQGDKVKLKAKGILFSGV